MSRWKLLPVVLLGALGADQWTKYLAVERLTRAFDVAGAHTPGERLAAFWRLEHLERWAEPAFVVFRPLWRMNYVENPFAAFNLFSGVPEGWRQPLFFAVTIAAVVFVLGAYRKLEDPQRWEQVALALILAGALGNFVDRVARGYVIDFVEWHWWNRPDLRWPTFNVADSVLVTGVAMLLVHPGKKRSPKAVEEGAVARRAAPR